MTLMKKAVMVSAMVLLTACGGGSSSSDSGNSNSSPNPNQGNNSGSNYVSGEFKSAVNTGDYWNRKILSTVESVEATGVLARDCQDNNSEYYFESDRVQVYGFQSYPESDFRQVATWIENNLDSTLSKMGEMTFNDYIKGRRNITESALNAGGGIVMTSESIQKPEGFEDWSNSLKNGWAKKYFSELEQSEQVAMILENPFSQANGFVEGDMVYPEKIRVCLHASENQFQYGEGTSVGINVAAPSVNNPSGAEQIIVHELVHMIQDGLMYTHEFNSLSRWFSEGQAVYISGQNIATNHNDYHTPTFADIDDERGHDQQEVYSHYGLAYKYIQDANSIDAIIDMVASIKGYESHFGYNPSFEDPNWSYNTNDPDSFIEAWDDSNLVDKNGITLTLQRWRDEYHSLMEQ